MKRYFVKTPKLLKFFLKNWVWSFSKKEKTIYLTFDDGPTPEITEWVLNELHKYKAKATFFCIGKNSDEHPEIFQKIIENNHAVGNHTHNHLNGWKTTTLTYLKNIEDSEKYFTQICHPEPSRRAKLFRPPYGKLLLKQAKKIRKKGYKIIMWDVLSGDFDTSISNEKCLQNVIKNLGNGSIVVFHDSIKASEKLKYTLPKILEYYTYKGFEFKSIE